MSQGSINLTDEAFASQRMTALSPITSNRGMHALQEGRHRDKLPVSRQTFLYGIREELPVIQTQWDKNSYKQAQIVVVGLQNSAFP